MQTAHHPANWGNPYINSLAKTHTLVEGSQMQRQTRQMCQHIDNAPAFEMMADNLSTDEQAWRGHLGWEFNHIIVVSTGGLGVSLPQACTCSFSAPLTDRHSKSGPRCSEQYPPSSPTRQGIWQINRFLFLLSNSGTGYSSRGK